MDSIKKLVVFTIVLASVAGIYVLFAPHQTAVPHGSWRHGVGEFAGVVLGWLLAVIYGRTALKLLVKNGPLMERILPEPTLVSSSSLLKSVIRFLNKTHPYVGAATVVFVFVHAFVEGFSRVNALMVGIFVLSVWQFAFGVFLIVRYQAVFVRKMKRYSYMAHSQLYTGVALGVFVLFGHLLIDG